ADRAAPPRAEPGAVSAGRDNPGRQRGGQSLRNSSMRLEGKIAIVTGGSRGIGRGIAGAFAREGARVAIVYRGNQAAADSLVQEITQAGGTARAYQADVADHAAVEACVQKVE